MSLKDTKTPTVSENTDELTIVAKIYAEVFQGLIEKMENRFVVGFSGAISIMLLTVENAILKKLETLQGLQNTDYEKKVLLKDIEDVKVSLKRMLERLD